MKLVCVTEARLIRSENNEIYSQDGLTTNKVLQRYLDSFSEIEVVARVFENTENKDFSESWKIGSDQIKVVPLPAYNGLTFLYKFPFLLKVINKSLSKDKVNLFKVPGILGNIAATFCWLRSIKYHIEILGDPYDLFGPNGVGGKLRPFYRVLFTSYLKQMSKRANAVVYVTKSALQRRYPTKATLAEAISDVTLPTSIYATAPKNYSKEDGTFKIISVGSLRQMYKSPDVVIKAVAELINKGVKCELTWIGEGPFMEQMIKLSKSLGIENTVSFKGQMTQEELFKYFRESDLFVLVSKTEGLPRAMIEAMAMGLPVIGTKVGGIPELLSPDFQVEVGDVKALEQCIEMLYLYNDVYVNQSTLNLQTAQEYSFEFLSAKRKNFFKNLIANYQKNNL